LPLLWIAILLWPPAAAGAGPCAGCHVPIANEMKKRVVHPGDCLTCHVDHKAGAGVAAPYLKSAEPGLCLACHDASSEKLEGAHQGQPIQTAACTECHDPHASRAGKLIYEIPHGPFAGRHCDECHGAPDDGRIHLHAAQVAALCVTCHVKVGNQLADSKSAHGAFPCTVCHAPHASNYRPHLRQPREALCRSCHEEPRAQFSH
jgi:predicted CXXCH cytochrome family protein